MERILMTVTLDQLSFDKVPDATSNSEGLAGPSI
jgi:hypothetical protein